MAKDHMAFCSVHQQDANGRCYTCHKPTCDQCNVIDGCCSQACYGGKQRFGDLQKVPRSQGLPWFVKLGILGAIGFLGYTFRRPLIDLVKSITGF